MCTAIAYTSRESYFGRNLDLDYHYRECAVIMPRGYTVKYTNEPMEASLYAMIGTATFFDDEPLFYDGMNEKGLCCAALNFEENAKYRPVSEGMVNLAPYELIPYILTRAENIAEAKELLSEVNLIEKSPREGLEVARLHFLLSDKEKSITVEPTDSGIIIYDNPLGVLTNNPPFPFHLENVRGYLALSSSEPRNGIFRRLPLSPTSRGIGALGLPGDYSSPSRFIRAAFLLGNMRPKTSEAASVIQGFHTLGAVAIPEGAVRSGSKYTKTQYTALFSQSELIYYYKTYPSGQIFGIKLLGKDPDGKSLKRYPLSFTDNIRMQN